MDTNALTRTLLICSGLALAACATKKVQLMGLSLPCGTAALDRLLGQSQKGTVLEDCLRLHYTVSINRRKTANGNHGNHGNKQARRHADEVRAWRQGSGVVKPGFQQNSK